MIRKNPDKTDFAEYATLRNKKSHKTTLRIILYVAKFVKMHKYLGGVNIYSENTEKSIPVVLR